MNATTDELTASAIVFSDKSDQNYSGFSSIHTNKTHAAVLCGVYAMICLVPGNNDQRLHSLGHLGAQGRYYDVIVVGTKRHFFNSNKHALRKATRGGNTYRSEEHTSELQ